MIGRGRKEVVGRIRGLNAVKGEFVKFDYNPNQPLQGSKGGKVSGGSHPLMALSRTSNITLHKRMAFS